MFLTKILRELDQIADFQRDSEDGFSMSLEKYPPIQIHKNRDSLLIKAEVPGVDAEEVELSVTDNALTISGEIKKEVLKEETKSIREERYYGKFTRTIKLPCKVDADKTEASIENGILSLTLPIKEGQKAKYIAVKNK